MRFAMRRSSGAAVNAIMRASSPMFQARCLRRKYCEKGTNSLRIEARAPARIDLAGGTLDIWPLYLFPPGALTVNCAVTRYASCAIETAPRGSRRIALASLDTNKRESFASIAQLERASRYRLPLLAQLIRAFRPRAGITLTTDSEVPAGAG